MLYMELVEIGRAVVVNLVIWAGVIALAQKIFFAVSK